MSTLSSMIPGALSGDRGNLGQRGKQTADPQLAGLLYQTVESSVRYVAQDVETYMQRITIQWTDFPGSRANLFLNARLVAAPAEAHSTTVTQLEAPQERGRQSIEMRWLVENSRALEAHRGEWLLIVGTELVAHSRDFGEVQAAITARGIRSPFVYYVPTEDESNFNA